MANDVYIKFGEDPDDPDLPDIEGDSTDEAHWWWCELRECGFDMQTLQQADENSDDSTKVPTSFPPVTLRKRVDWSSTQLFEQCCQAAMKMVDRPLVQNGTPQDGIIDQVTVEVCRPASGEKVTCVKVVYTGVRITKYGIALSGPEPAETITFEFDKVKFFYYPTDPYSGKLLDGKAVHTDALENHHSDDTQTPSGNHPGAGSHAAGGSSAGSGAGAGPSTPVLVPASAGGASPAPAAAPDPTINVNFPGLWQGNGFGLLPD